MLRGLKSITAHKKAPKTLKPQQARMLIRRIHILQKNKANILKRLQKHNLSISEKNYASQLGPGYVSELGKFKLTKKMEQFKIDDLISSENLIGMLARIDAELQQRGGLEAYQRASIVGQNEKRGGDSLKKLVEWFKNLGRTCESALEIGCLSANNAILTSKMFGRIDRLDLNLQSPQILEQDFMERPIPDEKDKYQLVSCSLVLNFVPTPKERGEMLRRITKFLKEPRNQEPSSLFLVLPLPCIANSRYFDKSLLSRIMASLGFAEVEYYEAKKIAYWLFDWKGKSAMAKMQPYKKKELYGGATRNNFYVEM